MIRHRARVALLVAVLGAGGLGPAASASAPATTSRAGGAGTRASATPHTAAQARAEARRVLSRVHDLQRESDAALRTYEQTLGAVARGVTGGIRAQQAADEAADEAAERQAALDDRVRALYQSGGPLAIYATVLESGDLTQLASRITVARRVLDADMTVADVGAASADRAQRAAQAARTKALDSVAALNEAVEATQRLQTLLDAQQALLAQATTRAQQLAAAERAAALAAARAAAARLAAARAAADRIGTDVASHARRSVPTAEYFRLYRAAAPTCPGLSWTVLAAIGQVESGHGRSMGPSSAGALGPMQFLPSTFRAYAVDGDHDGSMDIMSPADSIFTAAHYLCAGGAGRGADGLHDALFAYNHAEWYVQLVLSLAAQYAAG